MKRRSFNALGLLAILALLLSAGIVGVLAQCSEPPPPPYPPIRRIPPFQPPYGSIFNPEDPFKPLIIAQGTTVQAESPTHARARNIF